MPDPHEALTPEARQHRLDAISREDQDGVIKGLAYCGTDMDGADHLSDDITFLLCELSRREQEHQERITAEVSYDTAPLRRRVAELESMLANTHAVHAEEIRKVREDATTLANHVLWVAYSLDIGSKWNPAEDGPVLDRAILDANDFLSLGHLIPSPPTQEAA
jgi:hypothetical protein